MKARAKGEETWHEVKYICVHTGEYNDGNIDASIVEIKNDNIDWEQRRYELFKVAMQGLLANVKYQELSDEYNHDAIRKGLRFNEAIFYAGLAYEFANAAIKKLKE